MLSLRLLATALTLTLATPAFAQDSPPPSEAAPAEAAPSKASKKKKKKDPFTPVHSTIKKANKITERNNRKTSKVTLVSRDGAYFNGAVGYAHVYSQPSAATFQDGAITHLGLGYRFGQWAVEANFIAQLHEASSQDSAVSNTPLGGSLSAKLYLPIVPPRVDVYGQFGLGYLSIKKLPGDTEDISDALFSAGAGFDYRITESFALGGRASYDGTLKDPDKIDESIVTLSGMITLNLQL